MSLISIPFTFTVGAVIVASQHNSNFSTIYSDYNGNITDANIAALAAISDTKLAQITTAGKVSGASLTSLSSIISGAGVIPIANLATGTATGVKFIRDDNTLQPLSFKMGSFTRDVSSASSTQTVTGVGFTPKRVIFLMALAAGTIPEASIGMDDGTTAQSIAFNGSSNFRAQTFSLVYNQTNNVDFTTGVIQSFNSDGFVINWVKTGSPSANTMTIYYLAFQY